MIEDFSPDEYVAVMHRSNVFGTPGYQPTTGPTASWEYRATDVLHVVRPDNGEPYRSASYTCPDCGKQLMLRVQSVAAARSHRRRLRWAALGGLLTLVAAVAFMFWFVNAADAGQIPGALVAVGAVGGVLLAVAGIGGASAFLQTADGYQGIGGAGGGYPLTKHRVQLVEPGEDMSGTTR